MSFCLAIHIQILMQMPSNLSVHLWTDLHVKNMMYIYRWDATRISVCRDL